MVNPSKTKPSQQDNTVVKSVQSTLSHLKSPPERAIREFTKLAPKTSTSTRKRQLVVERMRKRYPLKTRVLGLLGPTSFQAFCRSPQNVDLIGFFFFENAQDMAEESLETSFEAVSALAELGPSQPKGKSRE